MKERTDSTSIFLWLNARLKRGHQSKKSGRLYSFQTKIPLFSLRRHLFLLREPLQERKLDSILTVALTPLRDSIAP